jgi:O-antigen ligase
VTQGLLVALVLAVGVATFAPESFWRRSSTIADFEEDASVAGRQRAWQLLGVVFEERPLSGVGAGASFVDGLVRFDVARGLYPEERWAVNLYVEGRF